jgi:hypothetical protein
MNKFFEQLPKSVQESFVNWQQASADTVLKVSAPMTEAFIALFYDDKGKPKNVAVKLLAASATSSTQIIKNASSKHLGKTMYNFTFDVQAGNESATARLGATDLEKLGNSDGDTWICKMSKSERVKGNPDEGYWHNLVLVTPAAADVDATIVPPAPAAVGGN